MKKYNINQFTTEVWNKTYVDPALQRRLVWNSNDKKQYLQSLFKGFAYAPMMVADIQSCLDFCLAELERAETVEVSPCRLKDLKHSVKYYTALLGKGYRYISIDGQNRSHAIKAFLSNDVNIQGTVFRSARLTHNLTKKTFYEDLLRDAKDFLSVKDLVHVTIINTHTRGELEEIFVQVNEGVALNDMEKCSAQSSSLGKYIRSLAQRYEDAFRNQKGTVLNWNRKDDEDWICKIAKLVKFNNTQNTKVANHAEFWKNASLSKAQKGTVERILEDFNATMTTPEATKNKISHKWELWALVLGLYAVHRDNAFTTLNPAVFHTTVIDFFEDARDEGDKAFGKALTEWHKNDKKGTKPSKAGYVSHWIGNADTSAARQLCLDRYANDLLLRLIHEGAIQLNKPSSTADAEKTASA